MFLFTKTVLPPGDGFLCYKGFSLSRLGEVTFNPGSKQAELYTVVSAAMNVFPFSQGKVHFLSEYLAGPVI